MSQPFKISRDSFLQLLKDDMIKNEHYHRDDYDEDSEYELAMSEFNDISTIDRLIEKLYEEAWDPLSIMRFLVNPFVELGDAMLEISLW